MKVTYKETIASGENKILIPDNNITAAKIAICNWNGIDDEKPPTPQPVIFFENGVFCDLVQDKNMGDYHNVQYSSGDTRYWLNQLASSYFLDNKNIWLHQSSARVWEISGNDIVKPNGSRGTHYLIPITRSYGFTKIRFIGKMNVVGSAYSYLDVRGCYIDNDNVAHQLPDRAFIEPTQANTFVEYESDISEMPYVDYIWLCGCNDTITISKIWLE